MSHPTADDAALNLSPSATADAQRDDINRMPADKRSNILYPADNFDFGILFQLIDQAPAGISPNHGQSDSRHLGLDSTENFPSKEKDGVFVRQPVHRTCENQTLFLNVVLVGRKELGIDPGGNRKYILCAELPL